MFYTDQNNLIDNNKVPVLLNDKVYTDEHENNQFYFDKKEHKLTTYESDGTTPIYTRSAPSMRLHLRTDIFYDKILNAPSGQLASNTLFKNYFRGIYFKVENGNPGNMAMINFKAGKITIYYKEDKITPDNVATTDVNEYKLERVSKTFPLNFSGNTISLLQNSNENVDYLNAANSSQEASALYLKGGEGAMAVIDLFSATDLYKYDVKKDINGKPIDENDKIIPLDVNGNPKSGYYLIYTKTNIPNGVSDELEELKYPAIDDAPGQIYHSIKNRWMINEANLTFYIDKTPANNMSDTKTVEPNRLFLYDLTNKKILVDYTYDFTSNGTYPKLNKYIYGGILSNEDGTMVKQIKNTAGEITNKGTKYRIRITNYVRNLIKNDSTNVRLGLSVTESINNIGLSKLRTPNSNLSSAPTMSVLSPLGTILYGTSPVVPDDKKLKLEIYYTKPN